MLRHNGLGDIGLDKRRSLKSGSTPEHLKKFKSRRQSLSQPTTGFDFSGQSGRLDAVRTFSGRGPRLESLLAAIDRQAGGWEMTERPKLSDSARATVGLQQWRDGRVHCSAWRYPGTP
jgi:hypothetical protein